MAIKDEKTNVFNNESSGLSDVNDLNNQTEQVNKVLQDASKITGIQAPVFNTGNAIKSNDLSPAPRFEKPKVPPSTAIQGELASLESQTQTQQDDFARNLEDKRMADEQIADTSLEDYITRALNAPTMSGLQSREYAREGGVDTIQTELNDINSQLRAEQQALRRRIEKIQDNEQGLFGGAVADEVSRVERESLRKQADLSVIQQSIQGRYDSAKAIADRAINAELESKQRELDLAELVYKRNQDIFDKSEQRAFETAQADRQRALDAEAKERQSISDLSLNALQNGASPAVASQMRSAKTMSEALNIGGRYIDLLDRSLKQQQLSTQRTNQLIALANAGDKKSIDSLGFDPREITPEVDAVTKRQLTEQVTATNQLIDLASQYKSIVDQYGYTNEFFGNSSVLGQIDGLRAQMTSVYRKAQALGTLDKGVQDLMDQLLGQKPTSSLLGIGEEGNIFSNITGRKSNKVSNSLDVFITEAERSKAQSELRLGINPLQNSLLNDDDNLEIDSLFNETQFTPANYY